MIKAVNTVKEAIEERKFKKGETVEQVGEWSEKIEQVITEADGNVRKLTGHIKEINSAAQVTE